jgi:flagellar operon protein
MNVQTGGLQQSARALNVRARVGNGGTGDFASALSQSMRTQQLSFSAHAQTRIKSRNIQMDAHDMQRLTNAVDRAGSKGSRDSLILLRNKAFIVNIPNRTVITAMDGNNLRENVFTNIDSTVIAE